MSGSAWRSTSPARTSESIARLIAGAPRSPAAATWLSVAGSEACHRLQQVALLAHRLGRRRVAAKPLDQARETRRKGAG